MDAWVDGWMEANGTNGGLVDAQIVGNLGTYYIDKSMG